MSTDLTPGEWLEDAFVAAGYNQISFAEAVNVAQSTVHGWVSGQRPRRRAIPAIAEALDVDVDYLLRVWGYRKRLAPTPDAGTAYDYYAMYREMVQLHQRMGEVLRAMERAAPYVVNGGGAEKE